MGRNTRTFFGLLALVHILALTGCYHPSSSAPVRQDVKIVLKEDDFKISKVNCEGSASVWYLFFVIPLSDSCIVSNALTDLYLPIREEMEGQPAQLINWTYDDTELWIPPFALRKKVIFRADLMKFTK